MRKMRTIDEAAAFVRQADPGTALTKTALRRLVTSGQIPSVRVGSKYLVDLNAIDEFCSGQAVQAPMQTDTAARPFMPIVPLTRTPENATLTAMPCVRLAFAGSRTPLQQRCSLKTLGFPLLAAMTIKFR